ncbi:PHP domain-containing protein [Streptomyces sp. NPDC092903]|uniref:PHP domain-containing protein n=1 Tax=Streptomyces sp. NPDC092903 TaxID=3366017 RepID=UPI0037F885C2
MRFAKAAAAAGVKPVFGVDLGVAAHAPLAEVRRRTPVRGGAHVVEAAFRATFLARDADGWGRLCRMVSCAHAEEFPAGTPPTASWEMLAQHAGEGLMVLLGPASEPLRALAAGRPDVAQRLLAPWRQAVGDGLRLEVVCWGLSGTGPGSVRLAAHTLALADHLAIPAVLTNAVRYADPGQYRLADVLDAARLLRPIDRRRLDSGERWLKDGPAMTEIAEQVAAAAGADRQRAERLIADTTLVADACDLDPARDLGLGVPHFPEPSVVGAEPGPDGAMRLAAAVVREQHGRPRPRPRPARD